MPSVTEYDRGPSIENILQGDFGEMWLEAVAAGCGILHGRPTTLDLEKADVELVLQEEIGGTYYPNVKVQVKTTVDFTILENGNMSYPLDVETYNVLRRTNHGTRRILAVVALSSDGDRVRLQQDGTLLVGRASWVSLEGRAATQNTTSVAVHLPATNTIDESGLRVMLETYGTRRSTPVPDVDPWGEGE